MRSVLLLLFLFVATALAKADAADTARSASQTAIIGSWTLEEPGGSMPVLSLVTYRANGTYVETLTLLNTGRDKLPDLKIKLSGTWKFEPPFLISDITHSSHPDFISKGKVMRSRIIEIDATKMRFIPNNGKSIFEYKRVSKTAN